MTDGTPTRRSTKDPAGDEVYVERWDTFRLHYRTLVEAVECLLEQARAFTTFANGAHSDCAECYPTPEEEAANVTMLSQAYRHLADWLGFVVNDVSKVGQALDEIVGSSVPTGTIAKSDVAHDVELHAFTSDLSVRVAAVERLLRQMVAVQKVQAGAAGAVFEVANEVDLVSRSGGVSGVTPLA